MKKILMISYDFPPARTSGIYRPVKFVKHLRSFGWEPIVLTAKNPSVLAYDETLLKDIPPGVQVIRTSTIDLFQVTKRIHDFLYRKKHTRDDSTKGREAEARVKTDATPSVSPQKGLLKRYFFSPLNVFVEEWLFFPDRMAAWFPFAFFSALRIMIREKPDVVFSTSAPQTSHLVGLFLKILFRKPWIVDFRDNWVIGYGRSARSSLRNRLDLWLFRQFLKRGDQVVTMCEGNAEDLIDAFHDPDKSKYQAITNGFDRDDFTCLGTNRGSHSVDKLIMLHIGTVYDGTAGRYFHALADLYAEDAQNRTDFVSVYIGYLASAYVALIEQLNLTDESRLLGFKPHPEAIKAMMDADVLLMFLGEKKISNQQFPGKFFEYLNAEKFILAIGQKGEIATALERSRCGILAPYNDAAAIKEAIKELLKKKRSGRLSVSPDHEFIARYEYRNLTRDLVNVLEKALKRRNKAKQ